MDRKNATHELKKREWLANFRLEKTVLVIIWTIAVLVTEAYMFFGLGESWITFVVFAVVVVITFAIITSMHGAAYKDKLQEREWYLKEAASNYFLGSRTRPKLDIDYLGKKYIFRLPNIDLLPIADISDPNEREQLKASYVAWIKDESSEGRQKVLELLGKEYGEPEISAVCRQAGFAPQCQYHPSIIGVTLYTQSNDVDIAKTLSAGDEDIYILIQSAVIIPFLTSSPFRRR